MAINDETRGDRKFIKGSLVFHEKHGFGKVTDTFFDKCEVLFEGLSEPKTVDYHKLKTSFK